MFDNIKTQLALINQRAKETDALYHALAVKLGLSDCAFWILYVLCEPRKSLTQYDLANEWFFPKQTVNSAINSLKERGYVHLQAAPGTRGRKTIHLTQAGECFCQQSIRTVLLAEQKALEHLSEDERRAYISLISKHLVFLKEETDKL